jgi:hypothetical protein
MSFSGSDPAFLFATSARPLPHLQANLQRRVTRTPRLCRTCVQLGSSNIAMGEESLLDTPLYPRYLTGHGRRKIERIHSGGNGEL